MEACVYLQSTQQVGARCSLQRVRLAAYAKRKRRYLPFIDKSVALQSISTAVNPNRESVPVDNAVLDRAAELIERLA